MKKVADGASFAMPATIDDPAILDEIGAALTARRGAALAPGQGTRSGQGG
jgi:propionyl-CoA synthetase